MKCTHKNIKRLYERGKSWSSTPLYKCQDCGEILQKGFEKVEPKNMNEKSLPSQTKDLMRDTKLRRKKDGS